MEIASWGEGGLACWAGYQWCYNCQMTMKKGHYAIEINAALILEILERRYNIPYEEATLRY